MTARDYRRDFEVTDGAKGLQAGNVVSLGEQPWKKILISPHAGDLMGARREGERRGDRDGYGSGPRDRVAPRKM